MTADPLEDPDFRPSAEYFAERYTPAEIAQRIKRCSECLVQFAELEHPVAHVLMDNEVDMIQRRLDGLRLRLEADRKESKT